MAVQVDHAHRDVRQHNSSRTSAHVQALYQYDVALDITTHNDAFLYNGAAWSQTAAYTDSSGNAILAPLFSTEMNGQHPVGVRVEMNGQSHDFSYESSDVGKSLHTLGTGTPYFANPMFRQQRK